MRAYLSMCVSTWVCVCAGSVPGSNPNLLLTPNLTQTLTPDPNPHHGRIPPPGGETSLKLIWGAGGTGSTTGAGEGGARAGVPIGSVDA